MVKNQFNQSIAS